MRSALLLLLAAGCSDPRVLAIDVTPGQEHDAFSRDPAIERVDVEAVAADGAVVAGATASPGGRFDLGEITTETLLHLEVRGYDGEGELAMRGRSLAALLGALEGEIWPVFAQRVERWSRPPSGFFAGHVGGVGGVLGARFLVLAGGEPDGQRVDFYDLFSLGPAEGGTLDFVPRSMVVSADARAILFLAGDRGVWLDFDEGPYPVEPPQGLDDFGDVVGGRVVIGAEAAYLVGATRSDEPSDRVLVVEADRSLRAGRLTEPRRGAAATWREDLGLVVAAGSTTAPGVEVMEYDAEAVVLSSRTLPFPPDATTGAALVTIDSSDPFLLGGTLDGVAAEARLLDLDGCSAACTPSPAFLDLGVTLDHCDAYALPRGALVVGAGDDGLQRSVPIELDPPSASVIELREPRRDAVVVAAPNGTLALYGGALEDGSEATSVETWFPRPAP